MPRPKSFDPDAALDLAMSVFIEKGYEAASIAELTDRMGINRFSLYDTYGDKRELYLAALTRYTTEVVNAALGPISAPDASLDELSAWLVASAEAAREAGSGRCCLVLRSAIETAPADSQAADLVSAAKGRVVTRFVEILAREQRAGALRADLDPQAAAWGLYAFHVGLAAIAPAWEGPIGPLVAAQIEPLRA